jgi:multiple sugar transport system substrate-binding protein
MDDKNVVFSTTPPQGEPNPPSNQRLTLDDLYGPSNTQNTSQTPPIEQQPTSGQQILEQKQQAYQTTQPPQQVTVPVQQSQQEAPLDQEIEQPVIDSNLPQPLAFWKQTKFKLILGGVGLVIGLLIIFGVVSRFLSSGGAVGGNVTLTYWGLWEDSKTMKGILDDFHREHPNIQIQYSKQDNKKYKDRLLTRIDNGTGPDIFTYHNTWLPTISAITLPLPNDVVTPTDFKKDYFPVVQKDLMINGAIYGIPQGIDTLALFVNKEIFDAAGLQVPQTWDEFIKAAKSITVKDETAKIKTAGAAIGTIDNIGHASDIMSLMLVQNGVTLEKIAGEQQNINDALSFYTAFATDKDNVWDDSLNPSQLAFANGEVGMMFGYSWDIFLIKAANPQMQFEIYPVPNLPGRKATIASYWVNGISSKSKHQKEALLFMQFLAQKQVQQKLYSESAKIRLFGTPYARIDLAKTLEDNPLVSPFVQQASYAQSTYFASDTQDTNYNGRLNAYLGNAVRAVNAGGSADSAIETLLQGVAQVRSQYGLQ